jgi:hypothetical protein
MNIHEVRQSISAVGEVISASPDYMYNFSLNFAGGTSLERKGVEKIVEHYLNTRTHEILIAALEHYKGDSLILLEDHIKSIGETLIVAQKFVKELQSD